jgi:type IV secretion system protein VirD4
MKTYLDIMTPDEVRMLDNRYALLFIRGERAVRDEKYDILKHPNVRLATDGGAAPYKHGGTGNELDWKTVVLEMNSDYELLSEGELETLSHSKIQEE